MGTDTRWRRRSQDRQRVNLDELQTRNLVNDSLDQAFGILRAGTGIKPLWPDLQLDLAHANLVVTEQVYGCPITLRLLDRCFRGITPYIPMVSGARPPTCSALSMPKLPNPWLRDANGNDRLSETEAWLRDEPAVGMLRREGVGATCMIVWYCFRHSSGSPNTWPSSRSRLRGYEQESKAGRINVLACSTTMEMGVDVGGVTTVAVTNVPPSPANYRQRVGRAGRRLEPLAVAFTYCPDDPLGWRCSISRWGCWSGKSDRLAWPWKADRSSAGTLTPFSWASTSHRPNAHRCEIPLGFRRSGFSVRLTTRIHHPKRLSRGCVIATTSRR